MQLAPDAADAIFETAKSVLFPNWLARAGFVANPQTFSASKQAGVLPNITSHSVNQSVPLPPIMSTGPLEWLSESRRRSPGLSAPTPRQHYCLEKAFKRYSRGESMSWSHNTGDGKWCREAK